MNKTLITENEKKMLISELDPIHIFSCNWIPN